MYHPSRYRMLTSIVLSVVILLLSVLPVAAAGTAANEKISLDLREQLYTLPEDTVVKIGVIFVDSPTLEADMAERLAAIREDYRTGKLTPAQLFDEEEFDGVDLDVALRRRANAEIYAAYNGRCVEQLKGLPQTFMIVGSIDLFCDEDMDYAQKLMQAGVFTELHVEPGVPHAYEYLEGTPQASRFYELRDSATARMLGTTYDPAASLGDQYGGILKYLLGLIGL